MDLSGDCFGPKGPIFSAVAIAVVSTECALPQRTISPRKRSHPGHNFLRKTGKVSYDCILNLRLMFLGLANLTVAVVLFERVAWFASALLQWHEASS